MKLVARTLGTCPICEGTFKVRQGAIVHHGFTRPGDGMIHGDCFAVGHPPYEVSCEVTKTYRAQIEAQRASVAKTLASFKAGEVVRFIETRVRRTGRETKVIETEYVAGVTEPYTFARAHESRVRALEYRIRTLDAEVVRLTRMIDGWVPRDIRTVMETPKAGRGQL